MRRYSAAAVCATDLQRTAAQVPGATNPNQASSLLQQIGTGVVSCISASKQMGKIQCIRCQIFKAAFNTLCKKLLVYVVIFFLV